MKHVKIEIQAKEFRQEELIALLDEYNPTGFEQTAESLVAYFEADGFAKAEVLEILKAYTVQIDEIDERNWNEEWERNFQPVVVEDFVGVRADFHQPLGEVEHEIIITPKMSFGTGHHATTYLMMKQMRELDFEEKKVFDFGTGTGILAILAEKLGAKEIVAIDVDEWSIENAEENFQRNGCSRCSVTLSSQLPSDKFDLVLANINRNIILNYLPHLVGLCKKGTAILFSGLLTTDDAAIRMAAEEIGLTFQKRNERSGWISLLFVKAR